MNKSVFVVDISSDEKYNRQSISIESLHLNMIGTLDFSELSREALMGSEGDLANFFLDLTMSKFSVSIDETEQSPRKTGGHFSQKNR